VARSVGAKAKPDKPGLSEELQRRLREAGVLLLVPLAVYLLVCLFSYSEQDPSWSHAAESGVVHNLGGTVGAWIADLLRYLFGAVAYAFPLLLLALGVQVLRRDLGTREPTQWEPALRLVGFVMFFIVGPALAWLEFHDAQVAPEGAGGVLGHAIGNGVLHAFGDKGAPMLLLALFLVAVTLATGLSWFRLMDWTGRTALAVGAWFTGKLRQAPEAFAARAARAEREVVKKTDAIKQAKREPIRIEQLAPKVEKSDRASRETQIPLFTGAATEGELPPLSLLDEPPPQGPGYSEETLEVLSRQVELKLKDFRIEAKVVGVYPGPVITRF
jgi:S-DNA-T family DNA segregation ATPase FtsK/SpoIIIE